MQECKVTIEAASESDVAEAESACVSTPAPIEGKTDKTYLKGAGWGLLTISIWSGWFISSRFNVTTNLTPYDLVALRYGVAAIILLPVAIRLRAGIGVVSWGNALALFAGSGFIYSLCSTIGIAFAPAAEGAALTPGVMPMATAILSILLLKERVNRSQVLGFGFILIGVIVIGGLGLLHSAHQEWIGHVFFLLGAFLFAGYTIALRRSALTGLEATALVSLWSCAIYLPIYISMLHPRLFEVPPSSVLLPAIYQGVLTNVVSLVTYGRAVSILGASRASSFAALIPALAAILGIFILGEMPAPLDWIGIAAVSMGVYLASGAPLLRRGARRKGRNTQPIIT